jgi:hypothetical protein
VTSWTDIHASAESGRLVFVSDSAGHPKFRRTIVRGLVGWAPHWTFVCIAADDGENAVSSVGRTSSAQDIIGAAGAGIDLAKAHLELCLKLDQGLVVVITKLDLASKSSLRQTLSKVLTAIKATGRTPSIVPPDQAKIISNTDLATISKSDEDAVRNLIEKMDMNGDSRNVVPIILTSASKGTGIRAMHALLCNLPIPTTPTSTDLVGLALNPEQPQTLFHIEDVFDLPASHESLSSRGSNRSDTGVVVAGLLRFGRFSVGDLVVVGPFPAESDESYRPPSRSSARASPNGFGGAQLHPSTPGLSQNTFDNLPASAIKGEWHNARIVSLRNLRLPVHSLEAGQVGTVGVVFDLIEKEIFNGSVEQTPPVPPRVRKGLVMAIPSRHMLETGHTLQAASGFTASFDDGDINSVTPGSLIVVYIASIRASARVLRLMPHTNNVLPSTELSEMDDIFGLSNSLREGQDPEPLVFGSDGVTNVTFELTNSREWIELGSQILVMPGGGHGLYYGSERGEKGIAGLEGFVGKVVEVVD